MFKAIKRWFKPVPVIKINNSSVIASGCGFRVKGTVDGGEEICWITGFTSGWIDMDATRTVTCPYIEEALNAEYRRFHDAALPVPE